MIYEECNNHRGQHSTRSIFFYFPANGLTNPDVFQPKTFLIPREIITQKFSSSGLVVSEELGNKQTNRQTNSLTHSLTDWRFYRVITLICPSLALREYARDLKWKIYIQKNQSVSSAPSMISIPFIYHCSPLVTTRHSQRSW